jgi:hypothetical protein
MERLLGMATAGRPPVPIERKRLTGTLRADRLPNGKPIELEQTEGLPEPPGGLGDVGLEFWSLVYGSARWISHTTDRTLITLTAELVEEREQLRALVLANPEDYRLRSGLRELEKALTSNLALMGFTPADRSRLGFAEVKKANKLEELMRRVEEHRGGTE